MTNAPDVILDLRERPRLATTDSLYRMSVSDSASSEPVASTAELTPKIKPAKKIPTKIPTSYINPIIHSTNVISKINANIKSSMSSKSSSSSKTVTSAKRDKVIETKIENFDINESFPDSVEPLQENPNVVHLNRNTSKRKYFIVR